MIHCVVDICVTGVGYLTHTINVIMSPISVRYLCSPAPISLQIFPITIPISSAAGSILCVLYKQLLLYTYQVHGVLEVLNTWDCLVCWMCWSTLFVYVHAHVYTIHANTPALHTHTACCCRQCVCFEWWWWEGAGKPKLNEMYISNTPC